MNLQSLSSNSASTRSTRNTPASKKAVTEEEEGEFAGLQWLKVPHRHDGGSTREGRGRVRGREGGALKLELAIPTSQSLAGGEREGIESATYTSDFSKDSIEGQYCIIRERHVLYIIILYMYIPIILLQQDLYY